MAPGTTSPCTSLAPLQRGRAHDPQGCPLRSSLLHTSSVRLHGYDNKTYLRQRSHQLDTGIASTQMRPEMTPPPPDPYQCWGRFPPPALSLRHSRSPSGCWDPLHSVTALVHIRQQKGREMLPPPLVPEPPQLLPVCVPSAPFTVSRQSRPTQTRSPALARSLWAGTRSSPFPRPGNTQLRLSIPSAEHDKQQSENDSQSFKEMEMP